MTSYVSIPNGDIDQDSPITQPLMTALRDNPIAIAEGATGAPRVQGQALGGIRQSVLSATGINYVTMTGLDAYKWINLTWFVNNTALTVLQFQIQLSSDGGSTWTTARTLASSNSNFTGVTFVGLQDGLIVTPTSLLQTGMIFDEADANYNAVRVRQASISTDSITLTVVPYFWEAKV